MKYAHQYLQSAGLICGLYDGTIPLSAFLRQYFSQHKKFGSKDRKHISHLCYCYYRLGHAVNNISLEERTKLALFLCQEKAAEWDTLFEQGWPGKWEPSLENRIHFAKQKFPSFSVNDIFPWKQHLNSRLEYEQFCISHLVQPDLFLRLRPGKSAIVKQKLETAGIMYENISADCIALPNGSKIDDVLALDFEAVVQDYSSQRIAALMKEIPHDKTVHVWDCCAASGGKSLLAVDTLQLISLTVSDIRGSIIQNLRKRFEKAGVRADKIFTADLSVKQQGLLPQFDLIICDVPCTGSGTWGRTPEQLYFFKEEKISEYAALQKKIVSNVLPHIKPGGYFLYSTCSVFLEENENIVEALPENIETIEMQWLNGYDKKADSMFAALCKKKV